MLQVNKHYQTNSGTSDVVLKAGTLSVSHKQCKSSKRIVATQLKHHDVIRG